MLSLQAIGPGQRQAWTKTPTHGRGVGGCCFWLSRPLGKGAQAWGTPGEGLLCPHPTCWAGTQCSGILTTPRRGQSSLIVGMKGPQPQGRPLSRRGFPYSITGRPFRTQFSRLACSGPPLRANLHHAQPGGLPPGEPQPTTPGCRVQIPAPLLRWRLLSSPDGSSSGPSLVSPHGPDVPIPGALPHSLPCKPLSLSREPDPEQSSAPPLPSRRQKTRASVERVEGVREPGS